METMNTDTPETDANAECDQEDGSPFAPVREWVHADFARKLERERDRLDDQLDQTILRLGETQERMIDAERQRDRLAEALNAILNDDPDSPLYKIKEARAALAAWKEARSES
jgi:hypothetical protein